MASFMKKNGAKRQRAEKRDTTAQRAKNKRSLDSGAQKRRASARDDKPQKRRASARDDKPQKRRASARDDKPQKRRASAPDDGTLLYLYGISEPGASVSIVESVDGRGRIEAIACGDLVCWVSRVDAHEFGDELQARMQNLDWIAGASVRHQRVVAAVHEKRTVLPARFATLFVSEATLTADVQRRARQLRSDLRRVEGADEYGIKIFGLPKAFGTVVEAGSGRDYLQRKSQLLRQESAPTMTPEAERFIAELRGLAGESAPGGSVSNGQRHLLWQGALLVPRTERKRLESALAEFYRRHGDEFRVECTGPWPPYSFISVKAENK
jgi:hypothetical protein